MNSNHFTTGREPSFPLTVSQQDFFRRNGTGEQYHPYNHFTYPYVSRNHHGMETPIPGQNTKVKGNT